MPQVQGPIVSSSTAFAAVDDAQIKGGMRSVATLALRDAIPAANRKVGMVCYVEDTGLRYVCTNATTPTWEVEQSVPVNLTARSALAAARNSSVVAKSSYLTPVTGTGAFGSTDSTMYLFLGNRTMVNRDMPLVRQVQFAFATGKSNVTHLSVHVWRRAYMSGSAYWNCVGNTENLIHLVTESSVNTITLNTPLVNIQRGDHVGCSISVTGGLTMPLVPVTTTPNDSARTWYKTGITLENGIWDNPANFQNLFNQVVPIQLLGTPPFGVAIGDSLTAGAPGTRSFAEASVGTGSSGQLYFDHVWPLSQYTAAVESALGVHIQNMGISSETSSQIAARFAVDVVAQKPKLAFICCGTNDIAFSVNKTTWMNNMTGMLDACLAADIYPVVSAIPPRTDWCTPSTYWASQARRDWNATLASTLASNYQGQHLLVNLDSTLGQNYVTGDPGNLDKLQTAYDADSVHLTISGYQAWGAAVAAAIDADLG